MPGMPPLGPYKDSEISAPPANKASSGRFNAEGDPFLYLSMSKEVALAETRPLRNEKCSVASFAVSQGLKVVNLIPEQPLPGVDFSVMERFWIDLCRDTAQQFSSNDVVQRYRSLQYVASIFQEEGLEGIVYRSAFFEDHWTKPMEPWGGDTFYNYVLFDPSKASFLNSELQILKRDLSI
ncbi:MAG: RES family NAD+ phosphorylase [Shimia sp.]|nr:RES family NAD+ phosphorylase [Shimia sp.]